MTDRSEVVIVGAGLAGLSCAKKLTAAGIDSLLLEAGDGPGGRVRTDECQGFLLDRGFQVLLRAYPELRHLNLDALDLREFEPGAVVRVDGTFHTVADPKRRAGAALRSLLNPVGGIRDKFRVPMLIRRARSGSLPELFAKRERTALATLRAIGFSNSMIDSFFRPFLGGIFLGRDLQTTDRMMNFVLRMMAEGPTCIPARGMGALPGQLAAALPPQSIRYRTRVDRLEEGGTVVLADGARLRARHIVIATEGPAAARLLGSRLEPVASRSVTCLYFAADRSPIDGPWLVLNGEKTGPVNNLAAMSEVSEHYAPPGQALLSATVLGLPAESDAALVALVKEQLGRWYGQAAVRRWELLRIDRIAHAQPTQLPGSRTLFRGIRRIGSRLTVCGDHVENASINGALKSGRLAASAVARALRQPARR